MPRNTDRTIPRLLLDWYRTNKRDLPWRRTKDPYRIWVAEIMLQQTRVDTVIPYYERFLKRFPDVRALARAREDDVLKAWENLGYYSRARHLHEAARVVVKQFGGTIPAGDGRSAETARRGRLHRRGDPEHRLRQALCGRRRQCDPRHRPPLRDRGPRRREQGEKPDRGRSRRGSSRRASPAITTRPSWISAPASARPGAPPARPAPWPRFAGPGRKGTRSRSP